MATSEKQSESLKKENKKEKTKFTIQSDVKGRLKKIREGLVYSKRAVFVRELVQNSFRSFNEMKDEIRTERNKIWITIDGEEFTIRDNAKGCADHEELLTLDRSGFGIGFGEGFTSIYMVADEFRTETAGYDKKGNPFSWSAYLNIQQALDNPKATAEDLNAEIVKDEEGLEKGFFVYLKGTRIEEYYYEIIEEIKELCTYIPDIDIYLNGNMIEKENLFDTIENGPYTIIDVNNKDNRLYEGKITLTHSYFQTGIKVYFEHRFVQELHINGAKGIIQLKEKAVNLRSPDRTEIIHDKKRKRLLNRLEAEVKSLLKRLVANGKREEIDNYAKIIQEYLSVKEYINYLEIDSSVLSEEIEKELKQIDKMEYQPLEKKNAAEFYEMIDHYNHSIGQNQGNMDKSGEYEQNEILEQVQVAASVFEKAVGMENYQSSYAEEQMEIVEHQMEESPKESSVDTVRRIQDRNFSSAMGVKPAELIKKEQLQGMNIKDIKKKKNIVWCSKDEEEKYKSFITEFEYKNVFTFVSPHVLYDNALRHLGIPHVSEYDNCLVEDYLVTRTGAKTKKEERATELLSRLEKFLSISETFFISDIQCKRRVELNGKKIFQEKVSVGGYEQYGYIHLNRKSLYFGKISGADIGKKKNGIHDVKFYITNARLISHELAHKLFDTKDNTKEHFEREGDICEKILNWVAENS